MNILVTGGNGYIGSHIVKRLKELNHRVVSLDNLSNSKRKREHELNVGDIRDIKTMMRLFENIKFDLVVHCAALKNTPESIKHPLKYYDNNVNGTIMLLSVMKANGVNKIIFSSTAGVYSEGEYVKEDYKLDPKTPYSKSKLMDEEIIKDSGIKYVIFRYFNVAGNDVEGDSLIQKIKKDKEIVINGGDYNTPDGTPIRDYVHVEDIAEAHINAIDYLNENKTGLFNLGSNKGYSVKEVCDIIRIPYTIGKRRDGDIVISVADSEKARSELKWKPKKTLEDMLK